MRFIVAFVVALACTLVGASCSSPETASGTDASTPPQDGMAGCGSGYSQCGDLCVATKRDPQNCGVCGKACKSGEVCVQGMCALQCGGGSTKCGNLCVDTKSDPDNCGMCGTKCPTGQVCSNGKCALTCQMGSSDCSGACVDLLTNDDHCGMCGTVCAIGQRCEAGKCIATCQQGWTRCTTDGGTTCADLSTDSNNCGMCGNACPQGQFCTNGACGLACFGGTSKCGNVCVDLSIDPQNCGACNQPCTGTCFNGMCCSGSLVYCSGACRNLKTDPSHCGQCSNACGGPCNNGVCCGASEVICNGKCSNTAFDPQNCGMCGNVCPMQTPSCSNSTCTTSTLVNVFPPTGTLQDPGNQSVWGARYYTMTFAQPTTILAIEWRANLASTDFIRGGIWNPGNQQKLATGSQVNGNNVQAFYRSTINFAAQANTPYLVGVFMSNANTVFPRKDSPSYPFTVSGITVSACWSTNTSNTDIFPVSGNSWGPNFRLEIQ